MKPAGASRAFSSLVVLALLIASTPSAAEAPASGLAPFAGSWRLDVPASDFGKRGRVPRSREERIQVEGAWLSVRSLSIRAAGDTLLLEYRYRTDGDAVNLMRGQEIRTRGRREGAAVRFASETQMLMIKLQVNERWSVSADGATLTEERTSKSPFGEERQRLVFRRAP